MKVIRKGSKAEKPKRIKCDSCKSLLEYTEKDHKHDRDGRYIVCPICDKYLTV